MLVIVALYLGYLVGVVYVAQNVGLWNAGLLKDTVAWTLVAGLGLFGRFASLGREPRFFRKAMTRTLGFTAVAEFVLNIVSFSLAVELVLAILFTFLAALLVVATQRRELRVLRVGLERILVAGFFLFAAGVLWKLYVEREALDQGQLLLRLGCSSGCR